MAISRIKYGGVRGKALNYSEFLCDGIEDLENLPTNTKKTDDFPATCAIGSRAFIGDDTYMLFPSQEWKPSKLVVCDCGCIHGVNSDSESEEGGNTESTSEDLDKALSTIAAIIDGSITEIEDTKVTGTIHPALSGNSNLKSISFANATLVGEAAFFECTSLTSVSLPSATSIDTGAFNTCTSLTNINLPNATSIGDFVFSDCNSLTNINLPIVTSIDTGAFYNCTSLTDISLPSAISIGNSAFSGCDNLIEVDLPNVTTIGSYIFVNLIDHTVIGNPSITTIKLPSATTIGQNAFAGCTHLTDLYLPGAEASYTNAPFGLNTETCTIHYEYDFTEDEGEANTETPT